MLSKTHPKYFGVKQTNLVGSKGIKLDHWHCFACQCTVCGHNLHIMFLKCKRMQSDPTKSNYIGLLSYKISKIYWFCEKNIEAIHSQNLTIPPFIKSYSKIQRGP